MSYREITIEDTIFRAVPYDNGQRLDLYCNCQYCSATKRVITPSPEGWKLGTIAHEPDPESRNALPFSLIPQSDRQNFIDLPARATSYRQGIREFYEAHQRKGAQHLADQQYREYLEQQRASRTSAAQQELDQILSGA